MNTQKNASCLCKVRNTNPIIEKDVRGTSVLNVITGGLFILFPKCPICWAAYASLFSFIGLDQVAYNSNWKWLLLICFVLGSLILLRKHWQNKAFVNLAIYSLGVTLLALSYILSITQFWWIAIVAGIMMLSNLDLSRFSDIFWFSKRLA